MNRLDDRVLNVLRASFSVTKYCDVVQLGRFIVVFEAYFEDNEAIDSPINHPSDHRLKKRVKTSHSGLGSVQFSIVLVIGLVIGPL